jgi:hypothetical protein
MTHHPADRLSFDKSVVAKPVWNDFTTAKEAVALAGHVLLHAGPAFSSPKTICRPVLNSACVAAVFEGLASSFEEAEEGVYAGDIRLEPAQNYRVVTPLAAVVSASMPLHQVYDAQRGKARAYAPINGGNAPALRLGIRQQAVLDHIRWLNGPLKDVLARGLGEGIELIDLARTGLAAGDDCHGYTPAANAGLVAELQARTRSGVMDNTALEFLQKSPSMFLNLWMAASKCMMCAGEGVAGSGFITAAGGNGVEVGIQVAALPGRWFTAPSSPPVGAHDAGIPSDRALPAIGDSAVVEALGLGAMSLHLSPVQTGNLGGFMPKGAAHRREQITLGRHPDFRDLDTRLGLSARAVAETSARPLVGLGILDRLGQKGRIGAGVFEMPLAPFKDAARELNNSS